jgi:cbb3-type cytochrome oxidase subunit 3
MLDSIIGNAVYIAIVVALIIFFMALYFYMNRRNKRLANDYDEDSGEAPEDDGTEQN